MSIKLSLFSNAGLDNATFFGTGGIGGIPGIGISIINPNGPPNTSNHHCVDLNGRIIQEGVHFVPGPDECTLCVCMDSVPRFCKAVLCSPPQDCKSFRVGSSCCDFICLDDSLKKGKGGSGIGGGLSPLDMTDVVPKIIIASLITMLSLSLLFFLVHRLRQRELQGRINAVEASRRSERQLAMCDECDDTRSLDYSMYDFDRSPIPNSHLFPPQYLWWKPPGAAPYFPPTSSEAPPPYEEAINQTQASNTFNMVPLLQHQQQQQHAETVTSPTILTNENINHQEAAAPVVTGDSSVPGPSSRPNENDGSAASGDNLVAPAQAPVLRLPRYSESQGQECLMYRHSMSLPLRPNEFGLEIQRNGTQTPNEYFLRPNQRYSLQLVMDWSSSSTLSLSPNTERLVGDDGRTPSICSSSTSSSSAISSTNRNTNR